jgi:hypothetical protein
MIHQPVLRLAIRIGQAIRRDVGRHRRSDGKKGCGCEQKSAKGMAIVGTHGLSSL